eukprot:Ihof_evm2s411 gene=Ihof_evmTU2s411
MTETVWTAQEVRSSFIRFYESKEHLAVESSPVVPRNDPTLLFANAGMNQFKPIFLGTVEPNSDMAKYTRACDTQKCIRAGGKHNDLDDVGKDTYHHTFFEMLGSWSFGDYFKKEAIEWAWELLTKVYKLDPERLYVTYFGGNEAANLPEDTEARDFWLATGLDASRILPFDMKDNFWEMGETGPCGPCAEIHYDRIGGRNAADLVNMDDPNVLEIWNLVFMQFNRETDGSLKPLPNTHVDTGMGFERLVSVLQDKTSNYDTDVFTPLFEAIQAGTGARPYTGKVGKEDVDGVDMAYRVVADHIRTLTVAISDGGLPGNVGRNYVLRRIVRRAIRYSAEKLNAKPGFFASLVPVVVDLLGDSFSELKKDPGFVQEILMDEETTFRKTLDRGRRIFEQTADKEMDGVIPGTIAWRLYDTYGFPLDLVVLMAEERGMKVDLQGYEAAKEEAKLISQAGGSHKGDVVTLDVHAIADLKARGVPATDDSPKYNYTKPGQHYVFPPCSAKVVALYMDKKFVDEIPEDSNKSVGVVLDRSNLYAEQGGQIYDTGFLSGAKDQEFTVRDCQVYGGYVLHVGVMTSGTLKVGSTITATIDEERRIPIMCNHTATHLLNYALREAVTKEADQKGSLVQAERLRFDFSYGKGVTVAQLAKVEEIVCKFVAENGVIYAQDAPLSVAKEVYGLRAVFGEVYPDPVRIVSVGFPVEDLMKDPANSLWQTSSVEFCGGTHVARSGDLQTFAVLSEEGIAKGIRRIVAVTGPAAKEAHELASYLKEKVKDASKLELQAINKAVILLTSEVDTSAIPILAKDQLRTQLKELKKKFDSWDKARKAAQVGEATDVAKKLCEAHRDAPFLVAQLEVGSNGKAMDGALKQFKSSAPDMAVMLLSVDYDASKVTCMASVPKAKVDSGLRADEWVASVSTLLGGK